MLVRFDGVAREDGDADQRVELGHERGGCGTESCGDVEGCERLRAQAGCGAPDSGSLLAGLDLVQGLATGSEPEIVAALKADPELGGVAKIAA